MLEDRHTMWSLGMGLLVTAIAIGACQKPQTPQAGDDRRVEPPAATTCVVAVDTRAETLSINDVVLEDFRPETLRSAIGKPTRIEKLRSRQNYEERGVPGQPASSEMVEVDNYHYVYDDLGMLFLTRNSGPVHSGTVPERMRVFFANKRQFDHAAPPKVVPKQRGGCTLEINDHVLEPAKRVVPPAVDHRAEHFELHGATFGTTSYSTHIDSIYTVDESPYVHIYLDDVDTGRAAYAEIKPSIARER